MRGIAAVAFFLVARDDANSGHRAFCLECNCELHSLMIHELARLMGEHYRTHYEFEQAGQP